MVSERVALIKLPYLLYVFGQTGLTSDAASDQGLHCL